MHSNSEWYRTGSSIEEQVVGLLPVCSCLSIKHLEKKPKKTSNHLSTVIDSTWTDLLFHYQLCSCDALVHLQFCLLYRLCCFRYYLWPWLLVFFGFFSKCLMLRQEHTGKRPTTCSSIELPVLYHSELLCTTILF